MNGTAGIAGALWADPASEGMKPGMKLAFVHLCTCQGMNELGVCETRPARASLETGMASGDLEKAWSALEAAGFIVREGAAFFVPGFLRMLEAAGGRPAAADLRIQLECLKAPKLRQAACAAHPFLLKPEAAQDVRPALELPPVQARQCSQPSRTRPMSEEDIELARESERREEEAMMQEFRTLRQEYNDVRREGPASGLDEWKALRFSPKFPGLDVILSGLDRLKREDANWKRGYPEGLPRFLRDRMWEMEPRRDRNALPDGCTVDFNSPEYRESKRHVEEIRERLRRR